MTVFTRNVPRTLALTAGVAGFALILGACTAGGGTTGNETENAGGPSVAYGATDEEWGAAFDEIDEDFEIVWQIANSAASPNGAYTQEVADWMEEASNGHVSVEIAFQDAISGAPQEADEALADGRIDMHLLVPFQQPSDFPVAGTLVSAANLAAATGESYLGNYLATTAALNEVWFQQQELKDELADHGLTLLSPIPTAPDVSMACAEPVEDLADLEGLQIRVGPAGAFTQVEALGATPVSVVFADLFESLQRGIVDCLVIGTVTMRSIPGMTELAPYLVHPVGTSFVTTPGMDMAGANWPDWPLALQQMVYDAMNKVMFLNFENTQKTATAQLEAAQDAGGGFSVFDDDVNEALKENNATTIEGWRTSPLLEDGEAYVDALEAAVAKWEAAVADFGVTDASFGDYETWLDADVDWDAFEQLYADEIHIPNRPV